MIAGIDGCRKGWIAAIEGGDGEVRVELFTDFTSIVDRDELKLVVIDIPIGLTEVGPRSADKEARAMLGPRGCCVFPAPLRSILDSLSHQEASERRRSIEGKGVSAQLWGIVPKIAQVDRVMSENPALQKRVREGHPEVSFALMNDSVPIPIGKKKRQGQQLRSEALARHFVDLDRWISRFPSLRVDVIDAFSMLWTARRVKAGSERRFPEHPEADRSGLHPMIVA